jgi:SAM-dependent methyltransferase
MNRELHRFVTSLDIRSMDVLEISGTSWKPMPFRFYFATPFPEYDVCKGIVTSNRPGWPKNFDLIFIEQVLEHTAHPALALRHIHQMLRPGGYAIVSVPFLLRLHGAPDDHWRWSESGLRQLFESSGFPADRIHTGSWGNRACVIANLDDWALYDPDLHSLENEPDYPTVVWAIVQKSPT